jgi:hypothetical protein
LLFHAKVSNPLWPGRYSVSIWSILSTCNIRLTGQYVALLEEQRSLAKLKLAEILIAGINDATGMCVHTCGWSSKYAYA